MPANESKPPPADRIDALLREIIAILQDHGEDRWAMAFERVQEHVIVGRGGVDPLIVPRLVRDLLHMFRGGLGRFSELELTLDAQPARDATDHLRSLHDELHDVVRGALRPGGTGDIP